MAAGGTKPCASCGAPVADAALSRGALEDPDGRRYCSPCAAKMLRSDQPEAQALRSVNLMAPRQSSALIIAAKRASSARMAPGGKAEKAPAAPGPAAPAAKVAPAPPARQPSTRIIPGKKGSAGARPKPPAENGQKPAASASRISRRLSARAALPWYLRLTRAQIIGAACGVGAVLLLVIVVLAVAFPSRKPPPPPAATVVERPTRAHLLIMEATAFYDKGQHEAALKKLRAAVEDARASGREDLAVEANRMIYHINKSTPVSVH